MWELDHKESLVPKYWCFWTVVLKKTLERPLDCKEIQPVYPKGVLGVHWKDWCWSWNSNILASWFEELSHLKRPWCWERLRAGGEGDDKGWDGWMASPTQWTWIWVNSGSWLMDSEVWHAAVHGVTKCQTGLSDWTEHWKLQCLQPALVNRKGLILYNNTQQCFKSWMNWVIGFCLIYQIHLISCQPSTTLQAYWQIYARKMFPQPAGGRKCFPGAHQISNHEFSCYKIEQTYFSLAKAC